MPELKLDTADTVFSLYIRERDGWCCVRCGSRHEIRSMGLHCSHFFGRSKESTRFDEENADALCYGCHQVWGSNDREAYRAFKIKQLGQKGFDLLTIRANSYQKKDRKMARLYWRERLKQLCKEKNIPAYKV